MKVLYKTMEVSAMNGLGSKIYYNQDGMDWLRTIVRTVLWYHGEHDTLFVVSVAARRAQRLYYKKTDIRALYRECGGE
jgi:hypothetical protein